MDTKLSCYIWGFVGVIFGMLALLFPEQLQDYVLLPFPGVNRYCYPGLPFPGYHLKR